MYSEGTVDDSTCRKWFRKFRENSFNFSNSPVDSDFNNILELIESDSIEKLGTSEKLLELSTQY